MLSFEDLRIIPQLTDIKSRSECLVESRLGEYTLAVPLIIASMHSLVTEEMVKDIESNGSLVVQPREYNFSSYYGNPPVDGKPAALSTGFDNVINRAYGVKENGVLSIEVANGYQSRMIEAIRQARACRPDLFIMAGTVCDVEGYNYLSEEADAVLMGIGVGGACTTTLNTGVGLPAAEMLYRFFVDAPTDSDRAKIILCGGVRTYGDFVKAIAMGADAVMSGYFFKDCVNTGKQYYGEASAHRKGKQGYIEGAEVPVINTDKKASDVLTEAAEALQSAMSYSNSRNLNEFRARVKVTI